MYRERAGRVEACRLGNLVTAEDPRAPVYVDGVHHSTLQGEGMVDEFKGILEDYIQARYG